MGLCANRLYQLARRQHRRFLSGGCQLKRACRKVTRLFNCQLPASCAFREVPVTQDSVLCSGSRDAPEIPGSICRSRKRWQDVTLRHASCTTTTVNDDSAEAASCTGAAVTPSAAAEPRSGAAKREPRPILGYGRSTLATNASPSEERRAIK